MTIDDKIPSIIHQIWIGPRQRPTKWMSTWEIFCSENGFTYVLWDDEKVEKLLEGHPNKVVFDQARYFGMKADIARYEILAQHGGIYIDADIVYLNQHAEHFLNWRGITVVPEPLDARILGNAIIGATPEHPFMRYISDSVHLVAQGREKEFGSDFDDSWKIVGPLYLTQMLAPVAPALHVLEPNVFYPSDWERDQTHKDVTMLKQEFPEAVTFHYGYETCRIPERHPADAFVLQ